MLRELIPAICGVFAVADWAAVGARRRRLEWFCKPAVLVALVVAAVLLTPESGAQRWWFVAALVFSLAGDVFLMLTPEAGDWFVFGLGSFLVGHVFYAVGFLAEPGGLSVALVGGAAVVLAALGVVIGGRVLRSVDVPALRGAVAAYMTVISVMAALAVGTGDWRAAAGAGLFYLSDACIAWNKFVSPFAAAKLVIIVTYHLAQFLLVWSLT